MIMSAQCTRSENLDETGKYKYMHHTYLVMTQF